MLTWHSHVCMCVCVLAGVKVEGILRESADVALVEKRVAEYEQGEDRWRNPLYPPPLPTTSSSKHVSL